MNLWTYSLRDLKRRPGRSMLTFLSIVLGVATVFAVSATTGAARRAFDKMTETLSDKADAEITAVGGGRFLRQEVADIEKDPRVTLAVPLLHQNATVSLRAKDDKHKDDKQHADKLRKLTINGIGTEIGKEKQLRPFDIVAGRNIENDYEVLMENDLARALGIHAGDEVKFLTARAPEEPPRVVGIIRPKEIWAFTQGGLVYFRLEDWQEMVKAKDKIDALQIVVAPTASRETVLADLAKKLPNGLKLRSAREHRASDNVTLRAFEIGLDSCRVLTVVVALLLILNTFTMNVVERRGQIATLRLVGATRRQIMGLLLREGASIGLAGAVCGLPIGWGLAHLLAGTMEKAFHVRLQNPEVSLMPTLVAFALGPVVAVVAAFFPARRAGRISPLEGLRERGSARVVDYGWEKIGAGVGLFALSCVAMYAVWARLVPRPLTVPVAVLFLVALLLTFPLWLRVVCAGIYRLLRPAGPMEFELGYRQLLRTEGRAHLTWGILFMAVACSVATALVLTDVIADIRADVRRTNLSDFIIRVAMPNLATGDSPAIPDELHDEVAALPEVESVENLGFVGMETPVGTPTPGSEEPPDTLRLVAIVREFKAYEKPPVQVTDMDLMEVKRRLLAGELVISDILAVRLAKKVGDDLVLRYGGKEHTFRIAGVTPLYLGGGMALFADRDALQEKFGPLGKHALTVNAKPGQTAELESRLRRLCEDRGLLFQTYSELVATMNSILDTVVASIWILLALGFLIAVFGVTNTLLMNILEQTREIGLMRVIGMRRRQVRKMIFAQSAYVGILAIVPGTLAGTFLAYVIRASSLSILGDNPHFGVILPWLIPYDLFLFALVLLFGWIPAARAARLNILESIRSE